MLLEQPLDVGKQTFKGKRLQKKIVEEGDYEDISRHQCTLYSTETLEALRNLELCPTTSCMNLQDGVVFSFCCACKYWCQVHVCAQVVVVTHNQLPVSKSRTISVSPKEDTRNPLGDSNNITLFTEKFPFLSFTFCTEFHCLENKLFSYTLHYVFPNCTPEVWFINLLITFLCSF